MKKALTIYLGILVALFILFSLLDFRGSYNLEKKLWKLQREYLELVKDTHAVSDRTFDDLIEKSQRIIDKNQDSELVRGLRIMIGRIHELKGDYDSARSVYGDVFEQYKDDELLSSEIRFLIGKTYEVSGEWAKAEVIFRDIALKYVLTPVGMDIPMYITRYYRKINNYQKTLDSYTEALSHYKVIVAANPDSPAELQALRLLAKCYFDQNRWEETVETLGEILRKYGTSSYLTLSDADVMIKTINVVSTFKIKDVDIAVRLYEGLIAEDPKRPLSLYLQQMVDGFRQYKEQNGKEAVEK